MVTVSKFLVSCDFFLHNSSEFLARFSFLGLVLVKNSAVFSGLFPKLHFFQISEHCAAYTTCYYMLHLPALCGVCRGPIACISEVTGNGFVCKQPPVFSCLRKVSVIVACAIARNVHQGYMGGSNHLLARKKSSWIHTLYTHFSYIIQSQDI